MAQQTAVDFLESQYNQNGKLTAVDFYQAKEIFKRQIIIASEEAFNSTSEYYRDGALDSEAPLFGVLYYNETYKKD
jgi:hypothetical protein